MYEFARHIETADGMTPDLLRRRRDCLSVVLNLQEVLGMEPEGKHGHIEHFETVLKLSNLKNWAGNW